MARVVYPRVPNVDRTRAIDRLFWRAGFGPTTSNRTTFHRKGLGAAIEHLLTPPRRRYRGTPLRWRDGDGPLQPINVASTADDAWAIEVLWWLDRMIRTRAPLVERMTLNLHDHFATSNSKVNNRELMVAQNELLRRHALGNFGDLLRAMTRDHAMQWWLDLIGSSRDAPNENFARELMELFTIGPVHSQRDVKEVARAFTGWTYDWDSKRYAFDQSQFDAGSKIIFGHRGNWDADDAIRLCIQHPAHAPFLCRKLWGYFVPSPPSPARLRQLTAAYTRSGYELKPVLRVILRSRELYSHLSQPDMVKPPVVHLVGALRATRPAYLRGDYRWVLESMGQQLFYPPSVAGWDQHEAWLSTGTVKARWEAMGTVLRHRELSDGDIPQHERPERSLQLARAATGQPWVSAGSLRELKRVAAAISPQWDDDNHAAVERRQLLQHLLLAGPDALVH